MGQSDSRRRWQFNRILTRFYQYPPKKIKISDVMGIKSWLGLAGYICSSTVCRGNYEH